MRLLTLNPRLHTLTAILVLALGSSLALAQTAAQTAAKPAAKPAKIAKAVPGARVEKLTWKADAEVVVAVAAK